MTSFLTGIAASDGIAIAKAYRLETPDLTVEKRTVADPEAETTRFEQALEQAKSELEAIRSRTAETIGHEQAAIFEAHLLVLNDPELIGPIKETIRTAEVNAEFALEETSSMFVSMFESMDDAYMKERAADIRDVAKRVLSRLLGAENPNLSLISQEMIVVAKDLTPSDTVQLNPEFVKGFITDVGGRTSHSAILARTLEIPAVTGAKSAMATVRNGDTVIVDGLAGEVLVNPEESEIARYEAKQQEHLQQKTEWSKLVDEATVTADGRHVELAANIGNPTDVQGVIANGGEGIGLYRTEFLYMGRDSFPTEEEQLEAYSAVLKGMKDKPTVVRTLDIGGDKELSYLDMPAELNPFLGVRAIRLSFEREELFRTQLRALLRASVHGNLKIMFPMIATLGEFRKAKAILEEERERLTASGIEVKDDIEVGIMVEIPSTAVMADTFAKEVDFFSIGTNDLIQYTLAADRMNERVSYLYQPYNPAVLRLVKTVIDAAHKEGKWAGMCGEMAGDEVAVPILLGLGLDEFSMNASSILKIRSLLRNLSQEEMAKQMDAILNLGTAEEVKETVQRLLK
ncbi:phosphoenolpyruvate--protein phosphotransferase [Indiicoccus explosivorum]|uniref:phosphoenolpyruvate--protein phosphotransferase n=1 Tax=Indiicoccus explosivorum TaxID=1917864 RepID=UPI000B449902|nr:phosphoenolpyruvate--protein phosphotransferase [Indiicoccus explosivorum]